MIIKVKSLYDTNDVKVLREQIINKKPDIIINCFQELRGHYQLIDGKKEETPLIDINQVDVNSFMGYPFDSNKPIYNGNYGGICQNFKGVYDFSQFLEHLDDFIKYDSEWGLDFERFLNYVKGDFGYSDFFDFTTKPIEIVGTSNNPSENIVSCHTWEEETDFYVTFEFLDK